MRNTHKVLKALFSKMLVNVSIGFWTFSTRVPNKICLMLVWILLRMSSWFTPCLKDFFCSTLSISYNVWNVDLLLHRIQNHELILSILPIIKVFLKYSTIVWTHPLKNHVDVVIEYLNMRRWLVLNNLQKFLCSWLVDLAIILPTRTETVLKSVRSWMFPQRPMLWWRLFIIMVEVSVLATIRVTFFIQIRLFYVMIIKFWL